MLEKPVFVIDSNKRIVLTRTVEAGTIFEFSFMAGEGAPMTINSLINNSPGAVYVGREKSEYRDLTLVLYPGSEYPPVQWDGKNEWERYVENGIYTIGVEAFGRLGGYDSDEAQVWISTPFEFSNLVVDTDEIMIGLDTAEPVGVSFTVNKASDIAVEVRNGANALIRHITPSITNEYHQVRYFWNGETDSSSAAAAGAYSMRIICTPKDGSGSFIADKTNYPELALTVTQAKQKNDGLTGYLEIRSDDKIGHDPLTRGDARYKTVIQPQGQYLPDKQLSLDLEGKGTQIVQASPDLNYVAAYREQYTELWAEVRPAVSEKLRLKYSRKYEIFKFFKKEVEDVSFLEVPVVYDYYPISSAVMSYDIVNDFVNQRAIVADIVVHGRAYNVPNRKGSETVKAFGLIPVGDTWYDYKGLVSLTCPIFAILRGANYMTPQPDVYYYTYTNSGPHDGVMDIWVRIVFSWSPSPISRETFLSYTSGFSFAGPDIDAAGASMQKTDFVSEGRPVVIGGMGKTDLLSGQDERNVWRKNLKSFFYFAGENYREAGGEPLTSSETEFDYNGYRKINTAGKSGKKVEELKRGNPSRVEVPSGYTEGDYTPPESAVNFKVDKTAGGYTVTVSTGAKDTILYPFPAVRSEFGPALVIGDEDWDIGIPKTSINGTRSNAQRMPNYHVEEGEICFSDEYTNTLQLPMTAAYDTQKGGYYGKLPLTDIMSAIADYPEKVNMKSWLVTGVNSASDDITTGGILGKAFNLDESGGDIELYDGNVVSVNGSAWDLGRDLWIKKNTLESEYQTPDTGRLLKYGKLPGERVSDLYKFPNGKTENALNMFHVGGENEPVDNKTVIIDPELRDYSGNNQISQYTITLLGIDGREYQGLTVSEPAYFGKGLKLSDGYTINRGESVFRALVPIYGQSEAQARLSYQGDDKIWRPIPLYKNAGQPEILTYWDVTGLQGKYLLRLYTETETAQKVVYLDVIIGQKIDSGKENIIQSIDGRAKLIVPPGISFPAGTVLNIDNINIEDIKDIVELPAIAPVGKVVKIGPDMEEITGEKPQLQFLYDREELKALGVNPASLIVYNLTSDGRLEALNTIRQLVRVEYDDNDVLLSETVLWDSGTDPFYDFDDYTYLKVWAVLDHFSYYMVMEGVVSAMPEVNALPVYTSAKAVRIEGKGNANTGLALFIKNRPAFDTKSTETPSALTHSGENREFVFNAVPLPFEGENYIYIGYSGRDLSEFRKIRIIRDTIPPELQVDSLYQAFSPNGDGIQDTIAYTITSNENGVVTWRLKESGSKKLLYEKTVNISAGKKAVLVIDGKDEDDAVLEDGEYLFEIDIQDNPGNRADTVVNRILLDTRIETPELFLNGGYLSPKNKDGVYDDSIDVVITAADDLTIKGYIETADEPRRVKLFNETPCGNGESITVKWGGRDAFDNLVKDDDYYITLHVSDSAGNFRILSYPDKFIQVDNTNPEITNTNFHNGDVFYVPKTLDFTFETSEEVYVDFAVKGEGGKTVFTDTGWHSAGASGVEWDVGDDLDDGNYHIEITETDRAGNTTEEYPFLVKITKDHDVPDIFGLDSRVFAEAEGTVTKVNIGTPVVQDRSLPVAVSNNAPDEFPLGSTKVTWQAVDAYKNTAEFAQEIVVEDTTSPVITALPQLYIEIKSSNKYTKVNVGEMAAYDIFGVEIMNNAPEEFTHGKNEIIWAAVDGNKNASVIKQTVDVKLPDNFSLPEGWFYGEIGKTPLEGLSRYAASQFISSGTGYGLAAAADQGHFLYHEVVGDFTYTAKIHALSKTDIWTTGGVMIRETLEESSKTLALILTSQRNLLLVDRQAEGETASKFENGGEYFEDQWMLIDRKGSTVSAYISENGEDWRRVGKPVEIPMRENVFIGVLTATDNAGREGRVVSSQFAFVDFERNESLEKVSFRPSANNDKPHLVLSSYTSGVLSLNDDGENQAVNVKVKSSKGGKINWILKNKTHTDISYKNSENIEKDVETTVAITGIDRYGNKFTDGDYDLELYSQDSVGNISNPIELSLKIDSILKKPAVFTGNNGAFTLPDSPKKDGIAITIIPDENVTITGYIGTRENPEYVRYVTSELMEGGKPAVVTWDGKDNYGNPVRDGNYYISLEVIDEAGNRGLFTYTELPVRVDNTAPLITNMTFKNGDVLIIPSRAEYSFEVTKRANMEFTIADSEANTVFSVNERDIEGGKTINWDLTEDVKEGDYEIVLRVWDNFGNRADPVILWNHVKRSQSEDNYGSK